METRLYRTMAAIRSFELRLRQLAREGLLRGSIHFCIGQEAAAAGVCAALQPEDCIAGNHRGHGHAIARGLRFDGMMAELLGKATGYCKGKGGSMHIADLDLGHLGANGIVGGGIAIATGAALGFQQLAQTRVAVAIFGDGAMNQGICHESMNLAALWRLPVIFVCENNQFGMTTPVRQASAGGDLAARAAPYGIPGAAVDGMDVRAVRAATAAAVDRARRGGGPSLLVMETYRFEGHYIGDPMVYRTAAEVAAWRERDPIPRERRFLLDGGLADAAALDALQAELEAELDAAVAFARESPDPDPAELLTDVYAEGGGT